MFEVRHDHHDQDFRRVYSATRSTLSAVEDKSAEAFRRHVWAVTMIDEHPLPARDEPNRHSTDPAAACAASGSATGSAASAPASGYVLSVSFLSCSFPQGAEACGSDKFMVATHLLY